MAQHVIHIENDEAWRHRSSRRSANCQSVNAQGRLADAHRNALALLAAGSNARIKRHVITHHGNAGEGISTRTDERRPLYGRRDFSILDQISLGAGKYEL